jgi:hypothetical protein
MRKITDFKRVTGVAFVNRTALFNFLDSFMVGPGVLAIGAPVQDALPNLPLTIDALGNLVQYPGWYVYDPVTGRFTVRDGNGNTFIDMNNDTDPDYSGNIFGYSTDGNNWIQFGAKGNNVGSYWEDDGFGDYRDYYTYVSDAWFEIRSDDNSDYGTWATSYMPIVGGDGYDHMDWFGNLWWGSSLQYYDDTHSFQFVGASDVRFDGTISVYGQTNLYNDLIRWDVDNNVVAGISSGQMFVESADGSAFSGLLAGAVVLGTNNYGNTLDASGLSGNYTTYIRNKNGHMALSEDYGSGSAVLDGGTVDVSDPNIKAGSVVVVSPVGSPVVGVEISVSSITEGVGFTISSSGVLDSRTVFYQIIYN